MFSKKEYQEKLETPGNAEEPEEPQEPETPKPEEPANDEVKEDKPSEPEETHVKEETEPAPLVSPDDVGDLLVVLSSSLPNLCFH